MFSFQGASLSFFFKRLNEDSSSHLDLQSISYETKWWAKMDSNHRPHDYQSCALASWAIGPYLVDTSSISLASATSCPKLTHSAASPLQIKAFGFDLVPLHFLVEISGIEPLTSCLQGRRSPSWAKPPYLHHSYLGTYFAVPSKLNNAKYSNTLYWP